MTQAERGTNGGSPSVLGVKAKVKTGCQTCKSRKVKCDEARPACKRCVSSGRACGGYGIWGGGGSAQTNSSILAKPTTKDRCSGSTLCMVPKQSVVPLTLGICHVTDAELENYDWFISRSAFKLPGLFRPRFWKSTLIQASTSEPAVRDAVLALGAIHRSETFVQKGIKTTPGFDQDKFMLTHYGRALKRLQPDNSADNQAALRVTIIACVVFVYIEFLRGHYQAGLTHLHHGLKLMQQLPLSTTTHYRIGIESDESILDWAVEPLLRMYLQANLLGQLPEPLHPAYDGIASVELPPIFATLYQARCFLDLLLSRILYLTHSPDRSTLSIHYHGESQQILHQLQTWHTSANATMTALGPNATVRDRITFSSQLNFYIIATILTSTLHSPTELAYDAHLPGFHLLLARAVDMYRASSVPGIRQAILGPHVELGPAEPVVDMGWLPGLYFVAVHCRVRRVRHHAVRLIRTNAHKEGMWDTELTAVVAEEVVRIEEEDAAWWWSRARRGSGGVEEAAAWCLRRDFGLLDVPALEELESEKETDALRGGEGVLPEWCRIRGLRVRLPDDERGVLALRYSKQLAPDGLPVAQCRVYDLVTKRWADAW